MKINKSAMPYLFTCLLLTLMSNGCLSKPFYSPLNSQPLAIDEIYNASSSGKKQTEKVDDEDLNCDRVKKKNEMKKQ